MGPAEDPAGSPAPSVERAAETRPATSVEGAVVTRPTARGPAPSVERAAETRPMTRGPVEKPHPPARELDRGAEDLRQLPVSAFFSLKKNSRAPSLN